jgi:hypothetical protein
MLMERLWLAALGLLLWQLGSMSVGFNEFMFGHPPTVPAILAALATVVAWIALAAWAGYHHRDRFGIAVAVLWLATVGVLLLAAWTRSLESGDTLMPWHGSVLLLMIAAGGPLYSLGSLVPVGDSLIGTVVVALVILAMVVAAYLLARRRGSRASLIAAARPRQDSNL